MIPEELLPVLRDMATASLRRLLAFVAGELVDRMGAWRVARVLSIVRSALVDPQKAGRAR